MYIYKYMFINIFKYIYVYIYTHTYTHTHKSGVCGPRIENKGGDLAVIINIINRGGPGYYSSGLLRRRWAANREREVLF